MSVKVKTVRNMANRGRSFWRVRRRAYDVPSMPDCDGEEDRPSTWLRCEEEYYTHQGYALLACNPERDGYGRQGYLDQIKALRVLQMMVAAGIETRATEDYEQGYLRVLGPIEVSHGRIVGV